MLYLLTLTWNGAEKLSKLKESLIPALHDLDYTWLIKDNASRDNTLEMASQWKENIKVIPYHNNSQNFSEGVNFLFKEANPKDDDMIMLLNNDIIINDTKSIHSMKKILESDSAVGAVGARLLFTGTDKLQHAGVVFDSRYNAPIHYRLNEKSDSNAEKNREFQVVTGAVLLTRAGYFKEVCTTNKSGIHGMDEKFHWAFDDVDFCLSIKHNLKKKIVYCGKTNIFHEESASLKKNPANKLFMNHNLTLLRDKWTNKAVLDRELYETSTKYNLYKE
jgi:GT2 family glycosyltransferase